MAPRKKPRKTDRAKTERKRKRRQANEKRDAAASTPTLSARDKLVAANVRALIAENGGSVEFESVSRYLPGGRSDVERFGLFEIVEGDGGDTLVRLLAAGRAPASGDLSGDGETDDDNDSDDARADRKRKVKWKGATATDNAPDDAPKAQILQRMTQMIDSGGGRVSLGEVSLEFPTWSQTRLEKLRVFAFHDSYIYFRCSQSDRVIEAFAEAMRVGVAGHETDGQRDIVRVDAANGVRFADVPILRETRLALEKGFHHERMTAIQEKVFLPILRGKDVLAKAKTGSGKTLAFLVPIVELLRNHTFRVPRNLNTLVVLPTRELATQVSDVAKKLGRFFSKSAPSVLHLSVQASAKASLKIVERRGWKFDFVVGTPGRMCSMIKSSEQLREHLKPLRFLVIDEADQLLERDFQDELGFIAAALPAKRQTLLFSATFGASVTRAVSETLRPDYEVVDVIGADGSALPEQILHSYAVTSMKRYTRDLWRLLLHQMAKHEDFKIIVFFQTVRIAQFFASLFRNSKLSRCILEVHSKIDSRVRAAIARKFRSTPRRILFSSDVSSRGMDYPDVTCVLQVGIPQSKAIYLHRLGRTGRAGKDGENVLLLCRFELPFLKRVRDTPITETDVPDIEAGDCPDTSVVPDLALTRVYASWLGFMCYQKVLDQPNDEIVRRANRFAEVVLGCPEPPPLLRAPLKRMGLPEDTPGLTVCDALAAEDEPGGVPRFVEGVNAVPLGAPDVIDWDAKLATGPNAAPMGERGGSLFGMDVGGEEDNANSVPLGQRKPKTDAQPPEASAVPLGKRKLTSDAPPWEQAAGRKRKPKSGAPLPGSGEQDEASRE